MKSLTALLCLASVACALPVAHVGAGRRSYADHDMLRCVLPAGAEQLEALQAAVPSADIWDARPLAELPDDVRSLLVADGPALETPQAAVVDMLVDRRAAAPLYLADGLSPLADAACAVLPNDLDARMAQELAEYRASPFVASADAADNYEFFKAFRPYDEHRAYFLNLAEQYPEFFDVFEISKTFEGRSIIGAKISSPKNKGVKKPAIYLEAMQHAREWLAPTTALYVLTRLLDNYSKGDATARNLLDNLDWYFVPMVNIDGYLYTWSKDRLWRKNTRVISNKVVGVDLNRNWGPSSTWCTSGSSKTTSSETYCGTAPFSEPEIQGIRDFLDAHPEIHVGIDFHTYGPLLLHPWQYTTTRPPTDEFKPLSELGKKAETAINKVHKAKYVSEQGSELYPHSGGFIDYNYKKNSRFTYTIELRGTNFVVAASEILLAGEENYDGALVFAQHVIDNYSS